MLPLSRQPILHNFKGNNLVKATSHSALQLHHLCACGGPLTPRLPHLSVSSLPSDNFYGTPKPPAEPSPAAPPLNVSEALLPGARPSAQGKRKRNQSVSNMEQRASMEPPEEEEEESPVVNGNGVAITPGTVKLKRAELIDSFWCLVFHHLAAESGLCPTRETLYHHLV